MVGTRDKVVRVLLVEDDEDDYVLTKDMLDGQDRARFRLEWCDRFDDALAAIRERRHDVYLIDYRLGERTGLDLVREGLGANPHAPVLMLTGQGNYEIDLAASALGITDYLIKQELTPASLERSIRYAIGHHQAMRDLAFVEERYALAARAASDGIWDWDLAHDEIYFSSRWHAILGLPESIDHATPAAWFALVHPEDVPALQAAIDAHLSGRSPQLELEHRMRHADGSWRWVLTRGLAIRDVENRPTRMAGSLSDITDRHEAEQRLQRDALHDGLTGLPNRALFMDRLDQVAQRSIRDPNSGGAVLVVDIDRFKLVNDSLSHAVGDHLLISLASRLAGVLRPGDTVARLGGDEFAILLDAVAAEDEALRVADRVHEALASAFTVDGHELHVSASVGIAFTGGEVSATQLLRNADIATYDAKRGGQPSAVFDPDAPRRSENREM